eukprot:Rhum_TRINITY_DN6435_c0_g1::Rhum_TRINITY_DN6435_c0_g1_i1::g.19917::m.19917/K00826/E2.6.1.42, ilvE; branched-chain amino acid aminotransferase
MASAARLPQRLARRVASRPAPTPTATIHPAGRPFPNTPRVSADPPPVSLQELVSRKVIDLAALGGAMRETELDVAADFAAGPGRHAVVDSVLVSDPEAVLPAPLKGVLLYEVFRVHNGKPLYLEGHLERLAGSVVAEGLPADATLLPTLRRGTAELIATLETEEDTNLKVVVHQTTCAETGLPRLGHYLYAAKSFYPPPEYYRDGVSVRTIEHVRENPSAKVLNMDLKARLAAEMKLGFYELLLLKEDGSITEGSRSNVFCIKDGVLFTAPDELVLQGITRSRVISLCGSEAPVVPVQKEAITIPLLRCADSVFITSTSNGIMPVNSLLHDGATTSYDVQACETLQWLMSRFFEKDRVGAA